MSGIEILGIAASVIQIADAGARLSSKLFIFTRKVKNADRTISEISQEIAATGAALRELGEALEQDKFARLGSRHSIDTTSQIVADCWKVFTDINDTIGGDKIIKDASSTENKTSSSSALALFSKPSFSLKQRLKFPYIEPQIMLLKSKLEGLKSSLMLMLQVLMLAEQVRNRPQVAVTEDQKALIETLIAERNAKEKQFRASCLAIENSDDPTSPQLGEEPRLERVTSNPATVSTSSLTLLPDAPVSELRETLEECPETPKATLCMMATTIPEDTPQVAVKQRALPRQLSTDTDADTASTSSMATNSKLTPTASIETSTEAITEKLPAVLRIRQEEIQHHAQLVHNLLEEISDVQYRIDHGIRHRMHDGVLKVHWDEWIPYAEKHGHEHFLDVFERSNHTHMSRYWLDQHHGPKTVSISNTPVSNDQKANQKSKKPVLKFFDAISRSFNLPFDSCRRWTDMEAVIIKTFAHIDNLYEHVTKGHYDLVGPDGFIILPVFWETTVEPGMQVNMVMWPLTDEWIAPPFFRDSTTTVASLSASSSDMSGALRRESRRQIVVEERVRRKYHQDGTSVRHTSVSPIRRPSRRKARSEHRNIDSGESSEDWIRSGSRTSRVSAGPGNRVRSMSRSKISLDPSMATTADSKDEVRPTDRIAGGSNASAATTGRLEHIHSDFRARSRPRSRAKEGLPIAAAGLGSAAMARLYEERKRKQKAYHKLRETEAPIDFDLVRDSNLNDSVFLERGWTRHSEDEQYCRDSSRGPHRGSGDQPRTSIKNNVQETIDEKPLSVNAKQFHRILKRRQAREQLTAKFGSSKPRRVGPVLHGSTDELRLQVKGRPRPRNANGRYLTMEEIEKLENTMSDEPFGIAAATASSAAGNDKVDAGPGTTALNDPRNPILTGDDTSDKTPSIDSLTEEQVSELREVFSLFDRQGDGKLGSKDLEVMMRSLGEIPTNAELLATMHETGNKGFIDFPDFLTLTTRQSRDSNLDLGPREAFKVFDRDETSFASIEELRIIVKNIDDGLTDMEFDKMIREAEKDGNGKVNVHDFIRQISSFAPDLDHPSLLSSEPDVVPPDSEEETKSLQPQDSPAGPTGTSEAALEKIMRSLDREKALIAAAKKMRAMTSNAIVTARLETQVRDHEQRVRQLEEELHVLSSRKLGDETRLPPGWTGERYPSQAIAKCAPGPVQEAEDLPQPPSKDQQDSSRAPSSTISSPTKGLNETQTSDKEAYQMPVEAWTLNTEPLITYGDVPLDSEGKDTTPEQAEAAPELALHPMLANTPEKPQRNAAAYAQFRARRKQRARGPQRKGRKAENDSDLPKPHSADDDAYQDAAPDEVQDVQNGPFTRDSDPALLPQISTIEPPSYESETETWAQAFDAIAEGDELLKTVLSMYTTLSGAEVDGLIFE